MMEAAGGGCIAVDSGHRPNVLAICVALWNSELSQYVYPELDNDVTMGNVVDHLRFLSATRCDISAQLEFIALHCYDLLYHRDILNVLPLLVVYDIISHGSLRIDWQNSLWGFFSKGIKPNREIFCLLEFVRLECSSVDVLNDVFDLFSGHFSEINASIVSSSSFSTDPGNSSSRR
jgi:hypothetical protein